LRWLSIVQSAIPRITTTDVEIAGVGIPAGQLVFVSLPSGNRDQEFIDSAEVLDIRRGAPGIWRSATVCTIALVPPWRGWRCASRFRRCCNAFRRWRWPRTSTMCSSGRFTSSTVSSLGGEMVKVSADRDVCISAGNCVMAADAIFDQDDDGIVVVLVDEVPAGEEEHAREAVKLCPSQALRATD